MEKKELEQEVEKVANWSLVPRISGMNAVVLLRTRSYVVLFDQETKKLVLQNVLPLPQDQEIISTNEDSSSSKIVTQSSEYKDDEIGKRKRRDSSPHSNSNAYIVRPPRHIDLRPRLTTPEIFTSQQTRRAPPPPSLSLHDSAVNTQFQDSPISTEDSAQMVPFQSPKSPHFLLDWNGKTPEHYTEEISYLSSQYFSLLSNVALDVEGIASQRESKLTLTSAQHSQLGSVPILMDGEEDSNSEQIKHDVYAEVTSESLIEGYFSRFFRELRQIGGGGFGTVLLCEHVLEGVSLGLYAIKIVPVGNSHDWLMKSLKEALALSTLNHPNVISYRHSWVETTKPTDFGPPVPCLFLLMQYANAGNLEDVIFGPEKVSEEALWMLFLDLCAGLRYLHHINVLHRDLKPQNLLLHHEMDPRTCEQKVRLLISDFGTCMIPHDPEGCHKRRTGATGTIDYMAPELLMRDSENRLTGRATTKSDVWSVGVILYALVYGCLPWRFSKMPISSDGPRDEIQKTAYKIMNHTEIVFPHVSDPRRDCMGKDVQKLILGALQKDPDARFSAEEIQCEALALYETWRTPSHPSMSMSRQRLERAVSEPSVDPSPMNESTKITQLPSYDFESALKNPARDDTEINKLVMKMSPLVSRSDDMELRSVFSQLETLCFPNPDL